MLVDVIHTRDTLPTVQLDCSEQHVVYVSRNVYDADMRTAFPTAGAARRQFLLDAPRCTLLVDGEQPSRVKTSVLSNELVPYATQSVMALPLEMLGDRKSVV